MSGEMPIAESASLLFLLRFRDFDPKCGLLVCNSDRNTNRLSSHRREPASFPHHLIC